MLVQVIVRIAMIWAWLEVIPCLNLPFYSCPELKTPTSTPTSTPTHTSVSERVICYFAFCIHILNSQLPFYSYPELKTPTSTPPSTPTSSPKPWTCTKYFSARTTCTKMYRLCVCWQYCSLGIMLLLFKKANIFRQQFGARCNRA